MTKTFIHLNLFNGVDNKIYEDSYLTVDDNGKIVAKGTGVPKDSTAKVDLQGKYVMPGLINAHTHIMMNPQTNKLEFLSEAEVTFTASINSSKLMGIDDEYGTLEVGKMADFLVLDDDPVEDVKAVQQVDKMVYKKGVKAF